MYSTVVSAKKCLPWIEKTRKPGSAVRADLNSFTQLISGDGFSVSFPTPLLLAHSPLIQSVLAQHHHCGSVSISLPSTAGGILILLAELLRSGETCALSGDRNSSQKLTSVQALLDILQCSVKLSKNSIEEVRGAEGNPHIVTSAQDENHHQDPVLSVSTPVPTIFTASTTNFSSKHTQSYESPSPSKSDGSSIILSPGETSIKLEEEDATSDSRVLYMDVCLEDILLSPKPSSGQENPSSQTEKDVKVEILELSCPFCQRVVKSQKSLKQHMMLRHPEPIHECLKCDASFSSKNDLGKHMKSAHFKFHCKSCHLSFKSKSRLCTHVESAHRERSSLEIKRRIGIGSSSSPRVELKKQLEWEHNDIRFSCDDCSKIFRSEKSFMKHCDVWHHDPKRMTTFKMPPYYKYM